MTAEVQRNNRISEAAFWRVISSITVGGVIGLFGLLWTMNTKLAAIEATMVTEAELQATIRDNVPPPWFREQVARLESRVEDHIESGRE